MFRMLPVALLFAVLASAVGQTATTPADTQATSQAATERGGTTQAAVSQTASAPWSGKSPAAYYNYYAVIPAAVAIVLAVITRQVILSLGLATLVAAWMYVPFVNPSLTAADLWNPVPAISLAIDRYLIQSSMGATDHIQVLLFTLFIGGMVGIVAANGGTRAIVERASRLASTPERGQIVGWLGGLAVFFDDFANAMVVGPTMRQITDKLRVSREKLAYIVDSTAAPVASLMIGTWFGAEISYIQTGLDGLAERGDAPAFLLDADGQLISGMRAYFLSWPFRFYPILAILMVFFVAWRGRDFGPMLTAERKAREGAPPNAPLKTVRSIGDDEVPDGGRAWYAVVPVLLMVAVSFALLVLTGMRGAEAGGADWAGADWQNRLRLITDNADSYSSILYGALGAMLAAATISWFAGRLSMQQINDAMMSGMARVFPALVVLVCAWALAQGMADLELAQVAKLFLQQNKFNVSFLPFAVFFISAIVSFATGSSWSTMAIICPIVVEVGAALAGGMEVGPAKELFYGAVGAVLAGSVFGDHCSPISDTTVLSSLASECDHVAHVWTQIPYAVVVAIVSMVCGDWLCNREDWHPAIGIALGAIVLLVFVQVVGRRPQKKPPTDPSQNATSTEFTS